MADGTRRVSRARRSAGARSVAQAEAELSDDVRRRLHARARVSEGWVPSAPDHARDDSITSGSTADEAFPDEAFLDEPSIEFSGDELSRTELPREDSGSDRASARRDCSPTAVRLRVALRDRVPLGLRGADVVPSRAAVAGLAGLLAAALGLALVLVWLQRPHESPVPSVHRSVPVGAVVNVSPSVTPSPNVVVHVAGAVRRPGLVELPGGSRVDAAVTAAGGATHRADLASVNLARYLVDGEQIVVLRKATTAAGAPGQSTGGTVSVGGTVSTSGTAPGQPIDLNTATLEQLDGLPGVGPVLAKRIVDWRTAHGRFSSVDQLTDVSGIGERTLADLRPLVRV
jgi:competence protein ComEA